MRRVPPSLDSFSQNEESLGSIWRGNGSAAAPRMTDPIDSPLFAPILARVKPLCVK